MIEGQWLKHLEGEFHKAYYKKLYEKVREEYKSHSIFPPKEKLFRAYSLCPYEKVKVVILGQDPYHNFGQAQGLSFSVGKGVPFPPSLQNIFKELQEDIGCKMPKSGELDAWAKQGVLLLNTVLTVRAHEANSHRLGRVYGCHYSGYRRKGRPGGIHFMGLFRPNKGKDDSTKETPHPKSASSQSSKFLQRFFRFQALFPLQCLSSGRRTGGN